MGKKRIDDLKINKKHKSFWLVQKYSTIAKQNNIYTTATLLKRDSNISEISKNTFSYGTSPVAASDMINLLGFGYYIFCLKTDNNKVKPWIKKILKAKKPKFCIFVFFCFC